MVDPVAFSIFGFDVHWYGLAYIFAFIFAYFFINRYKKHFGIEREELVDDIFLYLLIGILVGSRLFHEIFYNLGGLITNPLSLFAVWQGGMSAHGGILGAAIASYFVSKKWKISIFKVTDLVTIPGALGFGFGRIANYVNQELVGRVTDSSFGVVFPLHDDQTRWPVQLFDGAKNILLFSGLTLVKFLTNLLEKPGLLTAWFLIIYNFTRFFIDFLRVPTVDLGIISMGQLLTLIFGSVGVYILWLVSKNGK